MIRLVVGCALLAAFARSAPASDGDGVVVTLRSLGSRHSPVRPVSLVVSVKNTTEKATVALGHVTLERPTELSPVAPQPLASIDWGTDLPPGKVLEKVVTQPFARPPLESDDLGWLFLSAGTYTFRVVVDYTNEEKVDMQAAAELPVRFEAPLVILLLGALAGAMIIGVLRTWLRLLRRWRAGELTGAATRREIFGLLTLELPVSMLTALLAMVIARISTDFQGVLRVELNDIWAGVLVGMLAQSTTGPIAEALGKFVPLGTEVPPHPG